MFLAVMPCLVCWLSVWTRIIPGPGGPMGCSAVAVLRDGWRVEEPPGRKCEAGPVLPASSPRARPRRHV